jgi:hypothetical protein
MAGCASVTDRAIEIASHGCFAEVRREEEFPCLIARILKWRNPDSPHYINRSLLRQRGRIQGGGT